MRAPVSCAALCAAASLLGCADPAPTVEILAVSPDVLSASEDDRDDLTLTLRYTDADGDLGQGQARILDCRAEGLETVLPIPRIAPDEAVARGVAIEGELTLVVADVGAFPPSEDAPAACAALGVSAPVDGAQRFCVVLTDAAGNTGEGACTGPVRVEP